MLNWLIEILLTDGDEAFKSYQYSRTISVFCVLEFRNQVMRLTKVVCLYDKQHLSYTHIQSLKMIS